MSMENQEKLCLLNVGKREEVMISMETHVKRRNPQSCLLSWLLGDDVRQYLMGPPGPPGPPGFGSFNPREVAGRVLNLMNGKGCIHIQALGTAVFIPLFCSHINQEM